MKKRIMNHYSKIIVAILLAATLVFSAMPAYAISGTDEYKSTYGVSYEELFRKYPLALNNQTVDDFYRNMYSHYTDAMNLYSDTDLLISSFLYALEEGAFFFLEEAMGNAGIGSTTYEKCLDQVTQDFVRAIIAKPDSYTSVIKEISEKFKIIDTVYDFSVESGKQEAIEALKKCCSKMTDDDIEEAVDDLYRGASDFMECFGDVLDISTFVVSVIELQEIELALIDRLLDQQTSITSPLYQGLGRLRDDIAMDISGHITEKYLDEFAVKIITSTLKTMMKEGVKFLGADMPGSLATLTAKVFIKLAVKLYPSVTADKYIEAVIAGNFVSITESNLIQKKMYFLKNYASSEDIIDYELRYQAYLAAMQTALSTACVLADAKGDSSVYWGAYYSQSSIAAVSYEVYIKMCLATVQEAIKSGNISAPSNTPDVGSGEDEEEKDNTETIQSRLAALQSIYKPNVGQAWTDSWGGAIQCYGFVRMIFSKLYGCEMPYCYVNDARYKYTNENNVVLVGQLVGDEVTASSIKSLMSNARLGDVIQACGKTQHTMMVMSVNDDGIVVYDCNWKMNSGDGDCLIYTHSMSYDYLAQRYSQRGEISENGFSLYRAANYSSVYGDGSNFMYDDNVNFVIEDGVLVKYNGWQSNVVIPDTVTSIGASAFKGNTYMRTVTIPDGVTEIGNYAFENCTNLFRVNMPDSLLKIGISSFQNCSSLFYICIPDSVTMIDYKAFNRCKNLSSVDLSQSLTFLGYGAFGGCSKLTSIHIPKSLDRCSNSWDGKIFYGPFYNCNSLNTVTFETGTTQIAQNLFAGCLGLEEINIPETVTTIEVYSFYGCDKLHEVDIPNNVTEIQNRAFNECSSLEKVTLSNALTKIGYEAFGSCDSLTSIHIPKSLVECESTWTGSINAGPFYNCNNLSNVSFDEGITEIANNLFSGCFGLTEIEIPDTVTVIEQYAFEGCSSLESIRIPNNVTKILCSAFNKCTAIESVMLSSSLSYMGDNSFGNCTSLTSVNIPKSLDECGAEWSSGGYYCGPFSNCVNLKSISFEAGTAEIAEGLFASCNGIENVVIPNTVNRIERYAFNNCDSLKNVTIPGSVKAIDERAFSHCAAIEEIYVPDSVVSIGTRTFSDCENLQSVHISSNISSIPSHAFADCRKLNNINLPEIITDIGDRAFQGCTSLNNISFPNKLTSIGSYAFEGNFVLESVDFGGCETFIDYYAFQNCTSLNNVVIPDSVTTIKPYAFQNCDSLKSITLGSGIKTISDSCFRDCDSMESIVIPKGVTSIGSDVFVNDTKLTSIAIPITVTSINSNAFSYPDKLTIYGCAGSYAETFAKENSIKFVDITEATIGMLLVSDEEDTLRIIRGGTVTPVFEVYPEDTTDVITLTSGDTSIVRIENGNQVYGNKDGTVTVTATATSGMTYDFTVVVRTLSSIAVTETPDKLSYLNGEELDLAGMVITASYTDGKTAPVTGFTVSGFDSDKEGEQTVTVSYKEGGYTRTATFKVTVTDTRPKLTGIEIVSFPTKLIYTKGEAFDASGMTVNGLYSDGSSKEVGDFKCSGFNALKSGLQTITVTWDSVSVTFKTLTTETEGVVADTGSGSVVYTYTVAAQSVDAGDTLDLTALIPSDLTVSTWTSSGPAASVSDGIVTGVSGGSAIITASNSTGDYIATCSVTVVAVDETAVTVTFTPTDGGEAIVSTEAYIPGANGGTFEHNLPEGEYTIVFSRAGYTKYTITSFIAGTDEIPTDIILYAGDINGDGFINAKDNAMMTSVFGSRASVANSGYIIAADFNADGFINAKDRAMISANFSKRNITV